MTTTPSRPPMPTLGRLPQATLVTVLIALLVTLPAPALASHNSLGAHASLAEPTELDQGEIAPDVPTETAPDFHHELDEPRPAPKDQTGLRYTGDDACTPASAYNDDETHEQALRDGEACYVGYLDGRLLYMQFTQIFSVHRSEDLLYPANPDPDDEHCTAEDEPSPPDRFTESIDRSLNDDACQPATHDQHIPGYLAIDTALTQPPMQTDTIADGQASGTLTLPLLVTPYAFLFGDPHPDNDDDQSPYHAGEGPFSPALEGGAMITDLTDACGERTSECRLLTPEDIKRYDPHEDALQEAGVSGVGDVPRLCMHTASFTYEHPKPDTHLCGNDGRPMDLFLATTTQGGLGITDGPPTWLNTLPGWYRASVVAPGGHGYYQAQHADAYTTDPLPDAVRTPLEENDYDPPLTDDTTPPSATDLPVAYTLNPKVPLPGSPLGCLTPSILAEGTGSDTLNEDDDDGVYGPYQADAIDLDLYASPTDEQDTSLHETAHPLVRPLIATAENTLQGGGDPTTPLPEGIEATLTDATDRATPLQHATPSEPGEPRFTQERPAGVACTPEGTLAVAQDGDTLQGYLRFEARLQANTANDMILPSTPQPPGVHVKDPTVFDDEDLPSNRTQQPDAWSPDAYSLEGDIHAVLDTNQNEKLDPCADQATQGTVDDCLWKALWDAYNPACQGANGDSCGKILSDDGYDIDTGVGLFATITVTGPVALIDADPQGQSTFEERTRILGSEDPTAQNCILATSNGLAPKLAHQHGTTVDALPEDLCPDVDGETIVIDDAFRDQTADPARAGGTVERGDLALAIAWVPLAPTPDALEEGTGLGAGDQACLEAVFNVQENTIAEDTTDSLKLEGTNRFSTCIPL